MGYTVSNFLGVVGLSPCGKSRDEVQRALLQEVARLQLADEGPEMTLPWLTGPNRPNNEEIARRLAQHIGSDAERHGFGKLSTDEIAVQIERLLNRAAAGDKGLLYKTLRQGQADEARVIFDSNSGFMVAINPSAPGFGTAVAGKSLDYFLRFGQ